jgi:hypothetical protein
LSPSLGRNRDWPLTVCQRLPAVAAGSAADMEAALWLVPDLTQLVPADAGGNGDTPINSVRLRLMAAVPEATITGAATNYFTWNIRQYRAGTLVNQVNTTLTAAITATGAQAIAVASLQNIMVGTVLNIAAGGGTAETVTVTAISTANSTFTATFGFTHTSGTAVTGTNLATIAFVNGVNAAAYTPLWLTATFATINTIKGGDVLTVQRVSPNVTGLATPAASIWLEWVPTGIR